VLDMEPDVRGAIAKQLVIPLRSLMEFVGTFDVIEEKGSGSFRGRRNQVIEIDVFKPVIGAKPSAAKCRRRMRFNSLMVSGRAKEPCGPGTISSDLASVRIVSGPEASNETVLAARPPDTAKQHNVRNSGANRV
jgi:hypothetical protein